MDYEKKYKEALQRAKDFKDGIVHHALEPGESIVGWIFPELRESDDEMIINQLITLVNSAGEVLFIPTNKEELVAWLNKCKESLHISETCKENADSFTSEDERIRKYLVEELKAAKSVGELKFTISQPTREECIAYLEKQKDDRMKPIYDARESFESALEKAWNDYHNGYENVDKLEDDYVECAHAKGFREGYLFGIEKQKEQKPCEDSVTDGDIMQYIEEGEKRGIKEVISFPEKYGLQKEQKPAGWSEEDERIMKVLYGHFSTGPGDCQFRDTKLSNRQITAFLKSLRPQPHWKPSEEHLSALLAIFNDPNNIGSQTCQLALTDLYEQLKKL